MKPLASLAVAASALLLIAACGGGGGGSPSATSVPEPVDDPVTTRSLVGGSPLNLSGAQIEAVLDRRVRQANTLLMDVHDPDSFYGWIGSSCRGTSCRVDGEVYSTSDLLEEPTEIAGIRVEYAESYSPVMTYRGVSIAQARAQITAPSHPGVSIDSQGLGGWLDYSGFSVSASAVYEGPRSSGYTLAVVDHISVGSSSGTRPDLGVTGTATWEGAMVAGDTEFGHVVIGASTVSLDLAQMDVDVRMSNVWDIDARTRLPSFGLMDVPVNSDGTFGNGRTLEGSFYGPNHEEVGGIFTTDDLFGSFGAKRQ